MKYTRNLTWYMILLGLCTFLLIYGISPLDVTNDAWIMSGYDETDVIQHYSGWLAFRDSDWSFPIGMAQRMAVGDGTFISYTDSIPWVAIICKMLEPILPETFQYFGVFTLFCYILQAVGAFKILFYKTKNEWYAFLGTVLFCFSPILLERAFRHTALGAQCFVLFSIYLYLKHRDEPSIKTYIGFGVLELLAIGIHPYFLPMVACFALLCLIHDLLEKSFMSVLYFIVPLIVTYLAGYVIGVLGNNMETARGGYGFFSMNINALFNPTSWGNYTWSSFLKIRPQTLGNYDGFNYLGLGVFAGLGLLLVFVVIYHSWKQIWEILKKHAPLFLVCMFLFAFAISHVITFDDKVLLEIPVPEILLNLCAIFRASSRMFYPIYYLIFLLVILGIWHYRTQITEKSAYVIMTLLLLLQLVDVHNCILEKNLAMQQKSEAVSVLQDVFLKKVAKQSTGVVLDNCEADTRAIAVWALQNGMETYYSTANSGIYEQSEKQSVDIILNTKATGDIQDYVIVTTKSEVLEEYIYHSGILSYEYDGVHYIFKDKGYDK